MAKSIRSKRKRKFRAIKRNASLLKMPGELLKLSRLDVKRITLPFITDNEVNEAVKTDDISESTNELTENSDKMEVDQKMSVRNKHGNYPIWMNKKTRKRLVSAYRKKKRSQKH